MTTTRASMPPQQSVVGDLEQRTFRTLLECMSRPGSISTLPTSPLAEGPWGGSLLVMQCVLDHEVTFAVAATDDSVREQLLRRTGARTAPLGDAGFVLADAEHAATAIAAAREGHLEEPERSATVVIRVAEVGSGALRAVLSGPGIDGATRLELTGLEAAALLALRERNEAYPTGIDVVLVDLEGRVACLPRSTRIELED